MAEQLKLQNQVCFPVYSLAKEIIGRYRPFLDELDITYPQYLVLMVLWEHEAQTVSQLGEKLALDSGTLTPLLKRLEQKGIVQRARCSKDERVVNIKLTSQGAELQEKAALIPQKLVESMQVSLEDLAQLKIIVEKILTNIKQVK